MHENTDAVHNEAETGLETGIYELGYHILSSLSEDELQEEVGALKGMIEKVGGVFVAEEAPVMFRLAYTIVRSVGGRREKYDTSYFGWMKFELPFGTAHTLQEELEKRESILRFLIIKTVREDTRAGKRIFQVKEEGISAPSRKTDSPVVSEEKKVSQEPVSEEDLDRTIDELVVE